MKVKKIIPQAFLTVALATLLTGCGSHKTAQAEKPALPISTPPSSSTVPADTLTEADMYGFWGASGVIVNGTDFSLEQAMAAGLPQLADCYLVFMDDGTVYYSLAEESGQEHWSVADQHTVQIEDSPLGYDFAAKTLSLETDEITVLYEKISNSQQIADIPARRATEESAPAEEEPTGENGGIRPEFKAAMDSYEEFFDEYAAFMKKFQSNPSDMSLLLSYSQYLARYSEAMEKLDAIDQSELSGEELAYYIDVMARIEKNLIGAIR